MGEWFRSARGRLAGLMARLGRGEEFTCGDCERWERCGLPPNENCVYKAVQIASGDWKSRRRARALAETVRSI